MSEGKSSLFATCGMIALVVVALGVLGIGGIAMNWVGEASAVAQEELGPRALLKKYASFKDMSAILDARYASIAVQDAKIQSIKDDYEGVLRKDWDRETNATMRQWAQEKAGTTLAYNNLAAKYNSAMAKINYAFCNVGDLPKGATVALPRSHRDYITGQ